jgi:SAM-dependent methyltransferase
MIDSGLVASAHNRMAAEYDSLQDLWYPWLFAQVHEFIARSVTGRARDAGRALDAGCGTGFQSFLLARAGYLVTGIDVASALLAVAAAKSPAFAVAPLDAPPLFESALSYSWVSSHHRRLARLLDAVRDGRNVEAPCFLHCEINDFEFGQGEFDIISCCGSVLSFLDSYEDTIQRMATALSRHGLLFLEFEQKVNFDLLWPIADRLLCGRLEYEQGWREIFANLRTPPGQSIRIEYPFEMQDGAILRLPMWLFSVGEMARIFRRSGLRVVDRIGVHQFTNLLPSTVLQRKAKAGIVRALFEPLRHLDGLAARAWPMWRCGCSAVYCLQRL